MYPIRSLQEIFVLFLLLQVMGIWFMMGSYKRTFVGRYLAEFMTPQGRRSFSREPMKKFFTKLANEKIFHFY